MLAASGKATVLPSVWVRTVGSGDEPNPPAPFPTREGGVVPARMVSVTLCVWTCSPPRFGEGLGEGSVSSIWGDVAKMKPSRNIVIGQKVDPEKVQRAKELRSRMTPAEAALWKQLRANRAGGLHFRRQQVIAGFIVDFYCHAAGLVVELDGDVHAGQRSYDEERDAILAAHGLHVVRVSNAEVTEDLAGVLQMLMALCDVT